MAHQQIEKTLGSVAGSHQITPSGPRLLRREEKGAVAGREDFHHQLSASVESRAEPR
jgi:hypothetical protein